MILEALLRLTVSSVLSHKPIHPRLDSLSIGKSMEYAFQLGWLVSASTKADERGFSVPKLRAAGRIKIEVML